MRKQAQIRQAKRQQQQRQAKNSGNETTRRRGKSWWWIVILILGILALAFPVTILVSTISPSSLAFSGPFASFSNTTGTSTSSSLVASLESFARPQTSIVTTTKTSSQEQRLRQQQHNHMPASVASLPLTVTSWTGQVPSDCPATMIQKNDNVQTNNNTNSTVTILRSNKYADQVGIVLIVLKRKPLERQLAKVIQSIRRRGAWLGSIFLVVDDTLDIQKTLGRHMDDNVYTIGISERDLPNLQRPFMKYKRFKTELFDLTSKVKPNLEYLIYMDADILVGKSLVDFMDRTLPMLNSNDGNDDYKWLFFREQGKHPQSANAKQYNWKLFNSGVCLFHKIKSRPCLQAWQERFDSDAFDTDQAALLHLLYNATTSNQHLAAKPVSTTISSPNCSTGALPKDDLLMPNVKPLKFGREATFVHFTHGRLKKLSNYLDDYQRCVLLLDEDK